MLWKLVYRIQGYCWIKKCCSLAELILHVLFLFPTIIFSLNNVLFLGTLIQEYKVQCELFAQLDLIQEKNTMFGIQALWTFPQGANPMKIDVAIHFDFFLYSVYLLMSTYDSHVFFSESAKFEKLFENRDIFCFIVIFPIFFNNFSNLLFSGKDYMTGIYTCQSIHQIQKNVWQNPFWAPCGLFIIIIVYNQHCLFTGRCELINKSFILCNCENVFIVNWCR